MGSFVIRVFVSSAAALGACLAASASPPLPTAGWTLFDPDGDWTLSFPTPTSVRLDEAVGSSSAHPGWTVSDYIVAATATIECDIGVAPGTGDDDFIGFGFSFLDGAHSYLLDWKRVAQTFNWGDPVVVNDDHAELGLKIKRIDGSYTWDGLWGGTDGLGVSTIAGPAGQGWAAGAIYHLVLSLSPGHIVVTIDGAPLFDVNDPTYAGGTGAVALYSFSQDNVTLANVQVTPDPTQCAADFDGNGTIDAADLATLLGAWGTAGPFGDLDASGLVDAGDLAILLGAWGPCR